MSVYRNVDTGIDLRQILGERKARIPRERPAKTRLPRLTGNKTPDPRCHDQCFQHDCPSRALQCLVKKLQDGHESGGVAQVVQVSDTEEEGDGEEKGGGEADGYGAEDGDGDLAGWVEDFLGKVSGAVEAGEGIVGVYEADYER